MRQRRWMRRACAAAMLALAATGFGGGCRREAPTRLGGHTPLERAIDRAADFLETRPLGQAELWFVHQGARRLGRGFPRWAAGLAGGPPPIWAERVLQGARNLDMHRFPLLKQPDTVTTEHAPAMAASSTETNAQIGALFFAVEDCSHADARSRAALRQALEREAHGYLLAHQAWTLAVGVSRGCLAPDEVEDLRRRMGLHLLAELLGSDGLTDLDLERMAVLCVIDLCHWLPKQSVDRALEAQEPSGSWGSLAPPGMDPATLSPEHSAALGFYALASLRSLEDRPPAAGLHCAGPTESR